MSPRHTRAPLVSLLLVTLLAASLFAREATAQATRYTVTDLGAFTPASVNDVGQVAGMAIIGGRSIAVYYDGSLREIMPPGGAAAAATAVNNRGQVVGTVLLCGDTIGLVCRNDRARAFVYRSGAFTLLGTLGGRDSFGYDIDDAGRAVGYSFLPGPAPDISSETQAFTSGGGSLENIGAKMGVEGSEAFAASPAGMIAGPFDDGPDSGMFLYDSRDGTFSLIRLRGLPSDVNDLGEIVGHYGGNDDGSGRAFVYRGGSRTDLGTLMLPHTFSRAWGINNAGQIVGVSSESFFTRTDERAFLYEGGVMRDLNSLIAPNSGWVLAEATDINGHGQIVGRGTLGGQARAFMLTPVEPLLPTEAGTDRAVALDSVTFLRDPLAPTTEHNFSADGRTRLLIIVRNVETFAGENVPPPLVRAEDADGQPHTLAAEHVGKVPHFPALTQIVVRLPDAVAFAGGDFKLTVSFRGHTSNKASVRLRPQPAVGAR